MCINELKHRKMNLARKIIIAARPDDEMKDDRAKTKRIIFNIFIKIIP